MEKSKVYKAIWILLLSIVFTIDSALFGDDHVPYWAYLIKFVVMASLLTLGQKAMSSGDAETVKNRQQSLLLLSAVSAGIICMMVIWIRFTQKLIFRDYPASTLPDTHNHLVGVKTIKTHYASWRILAIQSARGVLENPRFYRKLTGFLSARIRACRQKLHFRIAPH